MNAKAPLVFDDGGFITSNPDYTGFEVPFVVYERLLELAKEFDIYIPIACTAMFFDTNSKWGKSTLNPDAYKILEFIKENEEHLSIWNHGLTHSVNGYYTEFHNYEAGKVQENLQRLHLAKSQEIFKSLGIECNTFVPPGHGWEPGVTDKIASEVGLKVIAIREFEKTSFKKFLQNPLKRYRNQFPRSLELETIYRLGLGIAFDKRYFEEEDFSKTKIHIEKGLKSNLIAHRRFTDPIRADHHFAHVQNLVDESSMNYFRKVIKTILTTNEKL